MFDLLRFNFRFFRAGLREIAGDYAGAAALLEDVPVPDRYRSLRDAYRLRMLVLAHEPDRGPEIIDEAQTYPWFREPKSSADEYASGYCRYVAAGVRGDVAEREKWAHKVAQLSVKRIYRNSLKVT